MSQSKTVTWTMCLSYNVQTLTDQARKHIINYVIVNKALSLGGINSRTKVMWV